MKRKIKFRAFWRDTLKPIPDFSTEYLINACNDDLFIVQQFTGLYDINGKEIYEGDILKYFQPYSKKWYTHIVKWDEKFASFGLFEKDNEWCKESDWLKIQSIEITGNIYEKV